MNSTVTNNISCSYYIWSNFSIFFTSISLFLSLFFGLLTWWYHKWNFRNQQIFYIFTGISSIFLLIESIDPLGLLGLINPIVLGVLSNISTWLSLVLFGYFIISVIKVVEISDLINWRLLYIYIFLGMSFIFTLVASILQVTYPIWQGIKLIVFAISLIIFTLSLDYYFYKIIKLFDRINNTDEFNNETLPTQQTRQWYLVFFIALYHILILVIVITQMYWGINLLNSFINSNISWENILLFSLHILSLIISEIFFLGRFKIELL